MVTLILQIVLLTSAEFFIPAGYRYFSGYFPSSEGMIFGLTMVPCAILIARLIPRENRPYFYALVPALLGVNLVSWGALGLGSLFFSGFQSVGSQAAGSLLF